jgi:hypothetical protein
MAIHQLATVQAYKKGKQGKDTLPAPQPIPENKV